jgi:hypothetical protein
MMTEKGLIAFFEAIIPMKNRAFLSLILALSLVVVFFLIPCSSSGETCIQLKPVIPIIGILGILASAVCYVSSHFTAQEKQKSLRAEALNWLIFVVLLYGIASAANFLLKVY